MNYFVYVLLSLTLLLWGDQDKLRIDGKYGLYISREEDHWAANWLTSAQEQGIYKTGEDGMSLSTASAVIHRAFISSSEPLLFEFGSATNMTSIPLRFEFERPGDHFENVDSIYVLGDLHGQYQNALNILKKAGLTDKNDRWAGGKKHLVFLGDVFDRGNDAIRLLWYIYELEDQAEAAGGKVHFVLGNHELMIMAHDDRYISPKERHIATLHQKPFGGMFDPQTSLLGRWLATKPGILRIDDALFMHGGLITELPENSIRGFNDKLYHTLQEPVLSQILNDEYDSTIYDPNTRRSVRSFIYDTWGPFWYRGYVQSDTLSPYLDYSLQTHNAQLQVVGHTIVPTITSRYKGKVIATNVRVPGTEMLLLARKRKKYNCFRIDSEGNMSEL